MIKRDGRHSTPPTYRGASSFDPKCRMDGVQQSRVAERLIQEFHGALLERLFPDAFVFLRGDEDNGNLLLTTLQFLLKVKSGHSRHGDVQDQAPGHIRIIRREKFLRGGKSSSVKA